MGGEVSDLRINQIAHKLLSFFGNATFYSVKCSRLPKPPSLTVSTLKALARHCPELEHCALLGPYDIASFREVASPLFPKLTYLSIGAATADGR